MAGVLDCGGIAKAFGGLARCRPVFPQVQSFRGTHQVGQRMNSHLFHDPAAVHFDGLLAGTKVAGDLLVQLAGDDMFHHIALARREAGIALPEQGRLRIKVALFGRKLTKFGWSSPKVRSEFVFARVLVISNQCWTAITVPACVVTPL